MHYGNKKTQAQRESSERNLNWLYITLTRKLRVMLFKMDNEEINYYTGETRALMLNI